MGFLNTRLLLQSLNPHSTFILIWQFHEIQKLYLEVARAFQAFQKQEQETTLSHIRLLCLALFLLASCRTRLEAETPQENDIAREEALMPAAPFPKHTQAKLPSTA